MNGRPSLQELEGLCQKIEHRRIGNWFARRVSRPMALRVTWVVAPWGVSAHAVTLLALACGVGAAVALAFGSVQSWLCGAVLLQAWYLLDHVDGQIARYRGTASLDGVHLDYMMHHLLHLLIPLGASAGLAAPAESRGWFVLGAAWAAGALLLNVTHDARYKAFVQRLKLVRGSLIVVGGGGGRPAPAPSIPRSPLRFASWIVRKSLEIHVVMNVLTILAAGQWLLDDRGMVAAKAYVLLMATLALALGSTSLYREIRRGSAEQEFAAWIRPQEGRQLICRDGWWHVVADDALDPPVHRSEVTD